RVQQQRADSPGPSCVSMKSDHSMNHPAELKDGNQSIEKSPEQQQRADSPGPSCVSMKSDHSMNHPAELKDGNQSIEKRQPLRNITQPPPPPVRETFRRIIPVLDAEKKSPAAESRLPWTQLCLHEE
ncbi:unnamed protein product, partial [Gadus morhua 'NCC']